ncbi:DUF58 domain-containing protein [Haliea atlantica]
MSGLRDATRPARGARIDLATLIGLRFSATRLSLRRRRRALAALAGGRRSSFRGRGIDFEEVRAYQPGDDVRSIDWRVTARTGQAHTKLFREERERPVLIVVDQRNSLFFGSRHCFKSVLAAHLGALLAWAALGEGDRVGGVVFDDADHHDIRPRRSRKAVLALLSRVQASNAALPLTARPGADDFAAMLGKLRRVARPGSSVYLVSDFQGADSEAVREQWFRLAEHTEVLAIQVTDPAEAQLPPPGRYAVTDGVQAVELDSADPRLRQRYQSLREREQSRLQETLGRLGIPLLQASTRESPLRLLQACFGDRR